MRNDDHGELDRVVDAALKTYSARQPRPGIEQRVIARLSESKRRSVWRGWAVLAPVLAGVLIVAVSWDRPSTPPSAVPPVVVKNVPSKEVAKPRPASAVAKAATRRAVPAGRPPVAKPTAFPAILPPTAEERAVMQLAAVNPEILQRAADARQQLNQPLSVEPIRIPLLEIGDSVEDQNDNE